MSELSKQALKVENNTSFPNNNNGQITPSDLRAFNVDMIDSTVNQTQYTSDSASWNQQIDALEQFTSSQQPSFNQLNAFTASQLVINTGVNSFTQSANGRLTALESETANLEAWTASVNEIADGGIVQGTSTRLHFAGLVSASIVPNVNGAIASILIEQDPSKVGTASFNAFTQSINNYTQSNDARVSSLETTASIQQSEIDALIQFTSSVSAVATGSLLVTASFNNGTRNLTFTKGDASTFAVNIPDASGSAGDFATTASFNSYTQSTNIRLNNLEIATASINSSITQLNASSASQQVSINNLNTTTASLLISVSNLNQSSASQQISINALSAATASYVTEAESGSFLITASFDNGTRNLTFTKGDTTTFAVNIPDVSGSTLNTASFATTGSNTFRGNQTLISSSITLQGSGQIQLPNGFTLAGNAGDIGQLSSQTAIQFITEPPAGPGGTNDIKFINRVSGSTIIFQNSQGGAGNGISFEGGNALFDLNIVSGSTGKLVINADGGIDATNSSFTASLQQGYAWVGDFQGISKAVATSSFGGGGSINTGSFATTGSNTFFGSNTFNNSPSDEFRVNWGNASSASMFTETSGGPNQTLNINSASLYINRGGLFFSSGSFTVQSGDMQFNSYPSASFTIRTQYGGDAILRSNSDFTNPNLPYAYFKATPNGGTEIIGFGNNVVISGSATTIQGVDFIPFSASLDSRILAITGSATNTGSLLVTASFDNGTRNLTFTKGDASTFEVNIPDVSGSTINTASFATTGSNTFTGIQTFQDAALNATSLVSTSGSLMLVAKGFTSASAHLTASANSFVNLIFKANNLTGDTIISGSGNIIVNPNAAAAGFKRYLTSNNWFTISLPAISASMAFSPNVAGNIGAMVINMRGPVSASASNIASNMGAGTVNIGQSVALNAEKLTNGWNVNNNQLAGNVNIQATQTALTGSENTTVANNLVAGNFTFQISSSAVAFNNNQGGGTTINNSHFSGSAGVGRVTVSANSFSGTGNIIRFTGSMAGTYAAQGRPTFGENIINGASNEIVIDSVAGKNAVYDSLISGEYLIVSASSPAVITDAGVYSTTMIGRYNANDGVRNATRENIFVVGTGISGSRKTGFLIDSGSNTFIEGTLNVSGSSTLSGSLYIQSGSTLPVSTGSAILTWDATTGQVKQAGFSTIVSASVSSAEFWSTITESGSAGVSGSITFNNSGSFYNVSLVNGTQLTVANGGVYNIQFSAQIETSAGADTVYLWFKKNGTNIGDSASKAVLANNTAQIMTVNILDEAQANDYYEIAYQTLNGNATILAEAASGNIPAIPSVIATIFQIR